MSERLKEWLTWEPLSPGWLAHGLADEYLIVRDDRTDKLTVTCWPRQPADRGLHPSWAWDLNLAGPDRILAAHVAINAVRLNTQTECRAVADLREELVQRTGRALSLQEATNELASAVRAELDRQEQARARGDQP